MKQGQEPLAELVDAETSPAIPAATLAAGAAGGSPRRQRRRTDRAIWSLAWPTMLSLVLANAVGLIDIAMLGRLGSPALAAVGYVTQYFMLAQAMLLAVGTACVALMSDWFPATTGEIVHVDGGVHSQGA